MDPERDIPEAAGLAAVLQSLAPGERLAELQRRELDMDACVAALAELADMQVRQDASLGLRTANLAHELAEAAVHPVAMARALRSVVQALAFLGRFKEALPLSIRAYELYQSAGRPLEAARTLLGRTHVLASLGHYAEAMQAAQEACDAFEQAGDTLQTGLARMNMGNLAQRLDNYSEALEHHLAARKCFAAADAAGWLAQADNNVGNALSYLDRPHEARPAFERSRENFAAQGEDVMVAMVDCNLGFLELRQCHYTPALRSFQQARQTFSEMHMEKDVIQMDMEIADAYLDLNLLTEAAAAYNRAMAAFSELGMTYEVGRAAAQLALVHTRQGEFVAAHTALERAREIFACEENDVWLATCDVYDSLLRRARGDAAGAAQLAVQAAQELEEQGPGALRALALLTAAEASLAHELYSAAEVHLSAARTLAETSGLPTLLYHVNHAWGRLKLAQGSDDEALAVLRQAIAAAERVRAALPGDALRTAYREDKSGAYQAMVALLLQRDTPDDRAQAFATAEGAKAIGLAEQVEWHALSEEAQSETAGEQSVRLSQLRAELNWYYTAITDHHFGGAERDWQSVREEIRQRERELARLVRAQTVAAPDPFQPHALPKLTISQLQARLRGDTALLEYYVADGEVMAFVVQPDKLGVYRRLACEHDMARTVRQLQFQFGKFALGEDYVAPHEPAMLAATQLHLSTLYQALIQPLAAELPARLIVVPHGLLHYVPFHALSDGEAYLVERHEISYAPSSALWFHCQSHTPDFCGQALLMAVADERAPYALTELQQLETIFPDARVLRGAEVHSSVWQSDAREASLIHLASHAVFRDDNPQFSALRLANEWLTVDDLSQARLNRALVSLSGCETGMNWVAPGDELVGLARALFVAGASTLVLSLWKVHDPSAAELFPAFYRHLRNGLHPAAALRAAQLEIMRLRPHPYYWAPFVVLGHP